MATPAPHSKRTPAATGEPSGGATPALGQPWVQVRDLTLAHATATGQRLVLKDLEFQIQRGEVLVLMGPSGCGKSTLLRALVGLHPPAAGQVIYTDGQRADDFHDSDEATRNLWRRRFGVMFQGGALWSSMTVGENIMLPMTLFTDWDRDECEARAQAHLAQVELQGQFDAATSALSGGMRKRAAIARALALDPPLLYLDEPSAGLDPSTSARLDALIARLRDEHGTTIVMVTHELASLMALADRALYLDPESRTALALGRPADLLAHGPEAVQRFLSRRP